MFWTSSTLRGRWRVISASQVPNQRMQSHGTPRSSRSTSSRTSYDTAGETSDSEAPVQTPELDLSIQLAQSESKFRVLTELNPVGMYYLNPKGDILYCNDMCIYHPFQQNIVLLTRKSLITSRVRNYWPP
jgi:PAS domain-containing protein